MTTSTIEQLSASYINAVKNWKSSQLSFYKEEYEQAAGTLINSYGVSPESLNKLFNELN